MHRAPNNMDKFMANITEDEQKAKTAEKSKKKSKDEPTPAPPVSKVSSPTNVEKLSGFVSKEQAEAAKANKSSLVKTASKVLSIVKLVNHAKTKSEELANVTSPDECRCKIVDEADSEPDADVKRTCKCFTARICKCAILLAAAKSSDQQATEDTLQADDLSESLFEIDISTKDETDIATKDDKYLKAVGSKCICQALKSAESLAEEKSTSSNKSLAADEEGSIDEATVKMGSKDEAAAEMRSKDEAAAEMRSKAEAAAKLASKDGDEASGTKEQAVKVAATKKSEADDETSGSNEKAAQTEPCDCGCSCPGCHTKEETNTRVCKCLTKDLKKIVDKLEAEEAKKEGSASEDKSSSEIVTTKDVKRENRDRTSSRSSSMMQRISRLFSKKDGKDDKESKE